MLSRSASCRGRARNLLAQRRRNAVKQLARLPSDPLVAPAAAPAQPSAQPPAHVVLDDPHERVEVRHDLKGSGHQRVALLESSRAHRQSSGMLQHVPPVLHVDLLRRELAGNQQPSARRSPSKLVMQAATSSREAPALAHRIDNGPQQGLSCSRRSRMRVVILNFLNEQKKLRHRKKLQRDGVLGW